MGSRVGQSQHIFKIGVCSGVDKCRADDRARESRLSPYAVKPLEHKPRESRHRVWLVRHLRKAVGGINAAFVI